MADRRNRLIERGIFKRRKHQNLPDRYESHPAQTGKNRTGALVVTMVWGDRWLSQGRPPLQLTPCHLRKDFTATVICDGCRKPVAAFNMRYRRNCDLRDYEADRGDGRVASGRF